MKNLGKWAAVSSAALLSVLGLGIQSTKATERTSPKIDLSKHPEFAQSSSHCRGKTAGGPKTIKKT